MFVCIVVINDVVNKIVANINDSSASLCADFVRQFFSTVSQDDLINWGVDDLYCAAIHFWNFIKTSDLNENKIRIYT